jgi:hypothetical protein
MHAVPSMRYRTQAERDITLRLGFSCRIYLVWYESTLVLGSFLLFHWAHFTCKTTWMPPWMVLRHSSIAEQYAILCCLTNLKHILLYLLSYPRLARAAAYPYLLRLLATPLHIRFQDTGSVSSTDSQTDIN